MLGDRSGPIRRQLSLPDTAFGAALASVSGRSDRFASFRQHIRYSWQRLIDRNSGAMPHLLGEAHSSPSRTCLLPRSRSDSEAGSLARPRLLHFYVGPALI